MKKKNNDQQAKGSPEALSDKTKYKYNQSQRENDKEHEDEYPDKPDNYTRPEERLLNPDKGEHQ